MFKAFAFRNYCFFGGRTIRAEHLDFLLKKFEVISRISNRAHKPGFPFVRPAFSTAGFVENIIRTVLYTRKYFHRKKYRTGVQKNARR